VQYASLKKGGDIVHCYICMYLCLHVHVHALKGYLPIEISQDTLVTNSKSVLFLSFTFLWLDQKKDNICKCCIALLQVHVWWNSTPTPSPPTPKNNPTTTYSQTSKKNHYKHKKYIEHFSAVQYLFSYHVYMFLCTIIWSLTLLLFSMV
jgi:hypothetical protein